MDLFVVFKGDDDRIANAYREIGAQKTVLSIPGATEKTTHNWQEKYAPETRAVLAPFTESTHSTFEDALQAKQLIHEKGYKRVVLITSDYHLPRSWLLLRLLTFGDEIDLKLSSATTPVATLQKSKYYYNETVKFWGSLLELGYYLVTGRRLASTPQVDRFVDWVEGKVLFQL
jgi:hypothetical protein